MFVTYMTWGFDEEKGVRLTCESLGCRSPKGENQAVFAEVDPLSRAQRLHGPGASVFLAVSVLGE